MTKIHYIKSVSIESLKFFWNFSMINSYPDTNTDMYPKVFQYKPFLWFLGKIFAPHFKKMISDGTDCSLRSKKTPDLGSENSNPWSVWDLLVAVRLMCIRWIHFDAFCPSVNLFSFFGPIGVVFYKFLIILLFVIMRPYIIIFHMSLNSI